MFKICIFCKISFPKPKFVSKKMWEKRIFCSAKCHYTHKLKGIFKNCKECGKQFYDALSPSHAPQQFCSKECWHKNHRPMTKLGKKRIGKANAEEKNGMWKDKPSKSVMHLWVRRHKGRALKCVDCGFESKGKALDWSNKDHSYKRILDDYQARCRQCHTIYDIKFNNKHSVRSKKFPRANGTLGK